MKNTLCHEMCSTNSPPTMGPAAVAVAEALTQIPTARLSSSGGKAARSRASVLGSSRAPNAPWTPRRRITPSMVPTRPMAREVREKPDHADQEDQPAPEAVPELAAQDQR